MITTGIVLGGAVTGSVYFLYSKMPGWMKKFAVKHYLISDLALTALIFTVVGAGSATAVLGSAFAWCATSTLLWAGHARMRLAGVTEA